jgi:hypothetical protein
MSVTTDQLLSSAAISTHMGAAHVAIMCEVIGALIEKGTLNQGDMISRLEKLSADLMTRQGAEHAVPIVDIVRNYVAKELRRAPS